MKAFVFLLGVSAIFSAGLAVGGSASSEQDEYSQILSRYGKIHTIAGRGQVDSNGGNDWQESFEGGPAREAELSEAHNAQADVFGRIYIVDKDSHAVRCVLPDGTIHRVAGTNIAGDGGDEPQPGTDCALSSPNGLHVLPDGTCFIFDTNNRKIRRLLPTGQIETLFRDPGVSLVGRGLWADAEVTRVYYASGSEVRVWTPEAGSRVLADGFSGGLANLTVDPTGRPVVADRNAHTVYRIESDGSKVRLAGNGTSAGGGDGELAVETGLEEVRGVAFAPSGGFFVCTHRGSDVWFVDSQGIIHLFINGVRNSNPLAGEGTVASSSGAKLSEVRAINVTPAGDLIITQSDESTVRIVENICPSGASSLKLSLENGVPKLEWSTSWDGARLQMNPKLSETGWETVAASAAAARSYEWLDGSAASSGSGFFRLAAAVRWPAP